MAKKPAPDPKRPRTPAPRRTKPRELSYEAPWEPGRIFTPAMGSGRGCLTLVVGGIWRAISLKRIRGKIAASQARRLRRRIARGEAGGRKPEHARPRGRSTGRN